MKYKLLPADVNGLHQIQALIGIPRHRVKAGDLGGFVQSEHNLSQHGSAWIGGNARVWGKAQVVDEAFVYENAKIFGDVLVYENARIFGNAVVCGVVLIHGGAAIYGNTMICGDANVGGGDVQLDGDALVRSSSELITVTMSPFNISITPQTIQIGCEVRSRYGRRQWTAKDPQATPELVLKYAAILRALKKQLPRAQG